MLPINPDRVCRIAVSFDRDPALEWRFAFNCASILALAEGNFGGHMELLGTIIIIVVFYFLVREKKTGKSGGKSFRSPIPKGYQIYAANFPVAGLWYRKSQALSFARAANQELILQREPKNEHDPNAIKLIGVSGSAQYFLGYLPKELSKQIVATGLAESVKPRLTRIYVGRDDYLDIQYQVIGPKTEKKRFDDFLRDQPADYSQNEYLKFFGLPIPKKMTSGQAELAIKEHKKSSNPEEQEEWDRYNEILEEFDDVDFREIHGLKKVGKTILLDALKQLNRQGKSYGHLSENIDEVVRKLVEIKPSLKKQS